MSCGNNGIRAHSMLLYRVYRGNLRARHFSSQPPLLSAVGSSLSTHHHPIQEESSTLRSSDFPFPSCSPSNYECASRACHWGGTVRKKPTSSLCSATLRYLSAIASPDIDDKKQLAVRNDVDEEVEPIDSWEEEDDAEPEIGDGGDGGGVVLQNCRWGECALQMAHKVLLHFGDDMKLYAFKTSPRGYIYVRLDKLSNDYGCPSMEEIESYSRQYKSILDEAGALGEIPDDLALEVSSPGAERLLKVPDDLYRFKDMPMRVSYCEGLEAKCPEKNGVFFLDSVSSESGSCVWRLADVKENRDPSAKGRPLSRKRRDWRLELPYAMFKRVTLYLDY